MTLKQGDRAFSSKVSAGLREENALNQKITALLRFNERQQCADAGIASTSFRRVDV
ncbi:hypothetical protein ACUSIJ_15410 [Pseudochelatococcus sp. B33]